MIRVVNDANLPESVFRALSHDGYDYPDEPFDISVTELISAPRRVELKRRHADKIVEKATDRVWSMMGHAVHLLLKNMESDDCITEQRFYLEVDGWVITGQTDLYEMSKTLSDFKNSGVFTFQTGDKEEHLHQLNMNALLFRTNGFEVEQIQIIAILRDHMRAKAEVMPSYPQTPIFVKPYELWGQNKQEVYARNRVALHKAARVLPDDQLPPCSDEERWYRGEAFAVFGEGNIKASPKGTFTVETYKGDAERLAKEKANEMTEGTRSAKGVIKKQYNVVHRAGSPVRCLKYCNVSFACNQHQQWLKDNPQPVDEETEES